MRIGKHRKRHKNRNALKQKTYFAAEYLNRVFGSSSSTHVEGCGLFLSGSADAAAAVDQEDGRASGGKGDTNIGWDKNVRIELSNVEATTTSTMRLVCKISKIKGKLCHVYR